MFVSREYCKIVRQIDGYHPARDRQTCCLCRISAYGRPHNTCVLRKQCRRYNICDFSPNCQRKCSLCNHCNSVCPDFKKEVCSLLEASPHVCNGCEQRRFCTLEQSSTKLSTHKRNTNLSCRNLDLDSICPTRNFALSTLRFRLSSGRASL